MSRYILKEPNSNPNLHGRETQSLLLWLLPGLKMRQNFPQSWAFRWLWVGRRIHTRDQLTAPLGRCAPARHLCHSLSPSHFLPEGREPRCHRNDAACWAEKVQGTAGHVHLTQATCGKIHTLFVQNNASNLKLTLKWRRLLLPTEESNYYLIHT